MGNSIYVISTKRRKGTLEHITFPFLDEFKTEVSKLLGTEDNGFLPYESIVVMEENHDGSLVMNKLKLVNKGFNLSFEVERSIPPSEDLDSGLFVARFSSGFQEKTSSTFLMTSERISKWTADVNATINFREHIVYLIDVEKGQFRKARLEITEDLKLKAI